MSEFDTGAFPKLPTWLSWRVFYRNSYGYPKVVAQIVQPRRWLPDRVISQGDWSLSVKSRYTSPEESAAKEAYAKFVETSDRWDVRLAEYQADLNARARA